MILSSSRRDFLHLTEIEEISHESFVDPLEILLCLLAVGADLPMSYSTAINCLKKIRFKFGFVEVFLHFFPPATPETDRLVAGIIPAKIVH